MPAKELLQRLSEATGVSGYEQGVRDIVVEAFRPYADDVSVTNMGSIVALQKGSAVDTDHQAPPKVLIEGHMDEIGLMVTDTEKGFIRFTEVGGFDPRVLLGQEVVVHGKRQLQGIIGSRPPHVLSEEEREKVIPMSDLFVDVGLPQQAVGDSVHTGDLITIARKMVTLKNSTVAGKAFDDRSAVVSVVEALRLLSAMRHPWDVFAVANVQEEVGLQGAFTSTYQVNPDVAIAIDVSFAEQPSTNEVSAVPLGGGMGIARGPNIHPLVHERLVKTAQESEIPYRVTAYPGYTGTNAWAMQTVREGVPTGLIDLPLRYMHSSVEMLNTSDLERIGRLLANFAASLDDQFLRQLRGEADGAEKESPVRRERTPRTRAGRATRRK